MAIAETLRIASPAGASLADIVAECAPGSVIELGPGRWEGDLFVTQPLRLVGLRGAGETVLVGRGDGPVIEIEGSRIAVTLEGLTVTGGGGRSGAGVSLGGYLESSIREDGPGQYSVRLVEKTKDGTGHAQVWISVDSDLPTTVPAEGAGGEEQIRCGHSNEKDASGKREMWPSIMEKAYGTCIGYGRSAPPSPLACP